MLLLGGCLHSATPRPPVVRLDAQGVTVRDERMAWADLTHLAEVTLPAPEGPFRQLVAANGERRSLTLCAAFTAPPSADSTAAALAGKVSVDAATFESVREAVCRAAGLELLDTTPQGPVYGRVAGSQPHPPPSPLTF